MFKLLISAPVLVAVLAGPVLAQESKATAAAANAAASQLLATENAPYILPTSGSIADAMAKLRTTDNIAQAEPARRMARTAYTSEVSARVEGPIKMVLMDLDYKTVGPIRSIDRSGDRITRITVKTPDGTFHRVPGASIAVYDGQPVTGYATAQIVGLPLVK